MSDPVSDLKQELLAAAERQQEKRLRMPSRGRWRGPSGRNRVLLVAATLPIIAAVGAPRQRSLEQLARVPANEHRPH